ETTRPGSRFARNSQCQENSWVSQPPSVGPKVGAMVATSPISTERKFRFSGGKTMNDVAKTVGIIAPPRKPCAARNTIIEFMLQASAHIALVSVKPAAATEKNTRVENSRERIPVSGIITTSA